MKSPVSDITLSPNDEKVTLTFPEIEREIKVFTVTNDLVFKVHEEANMIIPKLIIYFLFLRSFVFVFVKRMVVRFIPALFVQYNNKGIFTLVGSIRGHVSVQLILNCDHWHCVKALEIQFTEASVWPQL